MSPAPEPSGLQSFFITGLVAISAISLAVIGARLIGSDTGIDGVNRFVELLAGRSGAFLGGLVKVSSLFAFAAGLASSVNPCGFAMLPAYLGLYLSDASDSGEKTDTPWPSLKRALLVGGMVTAGFVILFGLAGTLIGLGASFIVQLLPWVGLLIGIMLAIAGAWLVSGGKLYTGVAARAASRIGEPGQPGIRGYFLFGVSYGVASLSCTLPIFLAVLGLSVADLGFLSILLNFFLFALGMGLVIMALTLGLAFFRGAMVGGLRKALPYIQPIGAGLMVIAGVYIIFYWLTIGGLMGG